MTIMTLHMIAGAFLLVALLLWALLEITRRPPSKRKAKSSMYLGGLPPDSFDQELPQSGYYRQMMMFLRSGALSRLHTGKLSDYSVWVIIGTIVIMALALMLW